MNRLVYSPKAYAFVRTDANMASGASPYLDISDYIVRGNVSRVVGAASTATLTLRNPKKLWTQPGNPVFHPMDPITIWLSRYRNYPVQVFTGYLDRSPYFQLYPGTVTLQASCTLKRLLHTYWDPALPFTREFLAKFGWFQDPSTGQMRNLAESAKTVGGNSSSTTASPSTPSGSAPSGGWLNVGDSLAVGSADALSKQLGAGTTNASVGRHTADGLSYLQSRSSLPKTLIVQLGTNDDNPTVFRTQVEAVLDLPGVEHVFWVNIAGTATADAFNSVLSDIASSNSKLVVIDWKGAVDSGKVTLSNGVHPDATGYNYRAQLIATSVDRRQTPDTTSQNSQPAPITNPALLGDGSISQVLYSVLTEKRLGNWDDSQVFIEDLPKDLIDYVSKIYQSFTEDNEELQNQLTTLLKTIVGSGSYGGGTGSGSTSDSTGGSESTGQVTGADRVVPIMARAANRHNVPPEVVVACWLIEWPSFHDSPGNPHYGYFQWDSKTGPPGSYQKCGVTQSKANGCYDCGFASDSIAQALSNSAKSNPSFRNNTLEWIMYVQGVTGQNNPLYPQTWSSKISQARSLVSRYGSSDSSNSDSPTAGASSVSVSGSSTTQSTTTTDRSSSGGSTASSDSSQPSRLDAIKQAADEMDSRHYTYTLGGGHNAQFAPVNNGYDCSGAVSWVLHQAGYLSSPLTSGAMETWGEPGEGRVTVYCRGDHAWMSIDGRAFGTSDGHGGNPGQPGGRGPGWLPDPPPGYADGFTKRHPPGLDGPANLGSGSGAGGGGDSASSDDTGGDMLSNSTAAAFALELDWPSTEDTVEAMALAGQKSLMNDQQLMPFIQQLTDGSLRQFQSLPNGDFFAFFPDYFGAFNHRKPYWAISDIEILDGKIELSDDALATHVYTVGDTGVPFDGVNFVDKILSGGVVTIFNAFASGFVLAGQQPGQDKQTLLADKADAVRFLQKYGARPHYEEVPAIRSPYYEAFYAFQTFQLLWSRTFLTEFQFTFMPEVYPGGIVAFPDYNLQCYVDSVSHDFDYEGGFTTTAQLSAPAAFGANDTLGISKGMVRANVTPAA